VLIVDDWAMAPLVEAERRAFLEICDERYLTKSTLLTSQLPVAKWHGQVGDPTVFWTGWCMGRTGSNYKESRCERREVDLAAKMESRISVAPVFWR
jgi:IstB-like ATP binding protein